MGIFMCFSEQVISSFQPSQEPWKRPNSRNGQAKTDQLPPSKLSPEGRESKIFNKFIKACIESARSILESILRFSNSCLQFYVSCYDE